MATDTVALLGYGRFGRSLGQLVADAGIPLRAYDPSAPIALTAHLALVSSISFGGFPTVLPDVRNFVACWSPQSACRYNWR